MSTPDPAPLPEEEIFHAAAALPAADRPTFLDAACAGQPELRARVGGLLAFHDEPDLLRQPSNDNVAQKAAELFARMKPEEAGERIGAYKLLQEIGVGGFGTVWMAEQERPVRRRVALKIIKLGMDTKEVIARFEQERQALAMMDHPNIAKVFDAGATRFGRPFFVMELVRGTKITDYCDEANLPTADRLQLFIAVCHAVQHAHQKGIIHRDLKPSNVLVTLHDGVPVPKVIDFGVAKATQAARLTDLTLFTQFEQMIGTPLYMSPEQAEMSGLDIDTRSDIYSLGVLLYELLTGRTPFDPADLMRKGWDEIRRAIREQEPQTPSIFLKTMAEETRASVAQHRRSDPATLARIVRGDLDWIVMKALEKDRTRRYETAYGLVKDIQRHLANEPVLARPASHFYRFRRLVRRNKLVFAAAAVVTAALIGGLTFSTLAFMREQAERREADVQRTKAVSLGHRAALLAEARGLRAEGLAGARTLALADLREAWKIQPSAEIRNEAITCLSMHELTFERTLAPGDPLGIPPESGGSADGRWGLRFENDTLLVLERATGREAARFSGFAARPLAQLDETGTHLAVVRDPRVVTLYEIPSGIIVHTLEHPKPVSCLDWAGELLAVGGGDDRLVHIWNTATGQRQRRFSGHDGDVEAVRFRPGGQELVTFADDGRIRLWDAKRGIEILRIEEGHRQFAPAWWDEAGSRFFCRRKNKDEEDITAVFRFDWSYVAQVLSPGQDEPRSENLPSLALSADGGFAAAVDETGCRVWSLRQGRLAEFFPKTEGEWMTVQLTEPSGLWLSGWNYGVRHFAIRNGRTPWPAFDTSERPILEPGPLLVASRTDGGALAFTHNEAKAAEDEVVVYWPAQNRRVSLAQVDPFSAALSPDGRFAVTGSFQQAGAQLWSLPDGKLLQNLPYRKSVLSASFTDDGKTLWLAGDAGVQRMSTDTWTPLGDMHSDILQFFTVSRDGSIAASVARHDVVLYRTPELLEIARLSVPESAGTIGSATLAFSGDGTRLAIHTAAGSIVVWNLPVLHEELRACGMEE